MRTLRLILVGLVVITLGVIGTFVSHAPEARGLVPNSPPRSVPSIHQAPRGELGRATPSDRDRITEADGALPERATVFDDEYPGIANLDPDLLEALRDATRAAADDGIELTVNSGWRSRAYQTQLFREAVSEYGSEEEAARWVATADTSPHLSGDAVDIATDDGAAWLSEHGAGYGLCQIYRNETWHFELRPDAVDGGCPPKYADPTRDPRMQGQPAR